MYCMRQGCAREVRGEFVREVKLSTGDVGVLLFADDMVIMAEPEEGYRAIYRR